MNKLFIFILIFTLPLFVVSSCSHNAKHPPSQTKVSTSANQASSLKRNNTGHEIANFAKLQLGKPYRYGGASPKGFDCSGLVHYTHKQFGIQTPRTSKQQYKAATPVSANQLELGDIVFFKLTSTNVLHVGIYIGDGQFIHAPKSGKRVSTAFLQDPYWKTRFAAGGRFY